MKYTRVAAIVAGSVAALGAASPAVAAESAPMPPMSLNGGAAQAAGALNSLPSLDLTQDGPPVKQVVDTASDLNNVKGDVPGKVLPTTGQLPPLLGGVGLGG
ncbi:hypothetical protein [Streptomyces sp. MUM 178J]|uniref:hypothetical protein n=1 Tax=Streptomyces sp. MUM 178J TaxID=2791991 RepID=UPI001F04C6AC|nr:hypothetical protein [Streptomyces sp. MUM 178J]WRQ81625.1 hypothetical protein I3F59_020980 [Streptomyces sp. MUM 178J]